MKHLATIPSAEGLRLTYLWPEQPDRPEGSLFEIEVSRICMGICFGEDSCFAVLLAERLLAFDRRSERERRQGGGETPHYGRYFLVIDEVEDALPQELIVELIALKDTYRAITLFGPDYPTHLVDSIKQTEGLTFYRQDQLSAQLCRSIWPTFIDYDLRIGYYARPVPDKDTVHRDLEFGLGTYAKDPRTGASLQGKDGNLVPLLNLPPEFNNLKSRQGIRQGDLTKCTALWYAFNGMQKSFARPATTQMEHHHVGNRLTGY